MFKEMTSQNKSELLNINFTSGIIILILFRVLAQNFAK
jgi:hypothetical protein